MKSLHILLHLLLLLTLSLFSAGLYAQPKPGDTFPALSLEDQFGTKHTVGPSDRLVIIAFDMDASEPFAEFLNQQGKTFLADNHSRYIADISGMPGLISKMFA
ncbi:MAG: hypothetical protein OIF35_10235, partial [Cellvibrionaceae bacterium]|nr:hypothetical protein [Cellvibrionaceae bacterium]